MPTEDLSEQSPPMPRDYDPGGEDATIVRALDAHNSQGSTHDERTNKHPLS